jgi:hypothetical protein
MNAVTTQNKAAAVRQGLVCGIDLGSKHDYTAIILLEVEKRIKEGEAERLGFSHLPLEAREQIIRNGKYKGQLVRRENHFTARHVKRLPLGTTYPGVVSYLKNLDRQLNARTGGKDVFYVVDATGLGQPVVDYLTSELGRGHVKSVYITGGQETHFDKHELRVPKQELVSMLLLMMQTGRIHLPKQEAAAMEEELLNFNLKVRITGTLELGAVKTGTHDDLVNALGLAVFYWQNRRIPRIRIIWI